MRRSPRSGATFRNERSWRSHFLAPSRTSTILRTFRWGSGRTGSALCSERGHRRTDAREAGSGAGNGPNRPRFRAFVTQTASNELGASGTAPVRREQGVVVGLDPAMAHPIGARGPGKPMRSPGDEVTRLQFSNLDPQFVQNRLLSSSTSAPQSVHTKGSSLEPLGSGRPQVPQNRWFGLADLPQVGHFRAIATSDQHPLW